MKCAQIPAPGREEFRALLMPGDAVFHHSQTLHRSDPNTTDRARCGLLLVYRGQHTRTDPGLKALYEKGLAKVAALA
jgi:ectoine hydroxylase-related dioxygenase (phytanoyl-CoA dioxygenase family)